jgi:hypothetical protein
MSKFQNLYVEQSKTAFRTHPKITKSLILDDGKKILRPKFIGLHTIKTYIVLSVKHN